MRSRTLWEVRPIAYPFGSATYRAPDYTGKMPKIEAIAQRVCTYRISEALGSIPHFQLTQGDQTFQIL
ncbi:hypothetical protein AP9108_32430 [Arthrospira sp. PCC 9108]|nr:hypothetical protein AP9108_32430 [Arthrospira sp. PCC 9108]